MWAGQGVSMLKRTEPAAEIVRGIWSEASGTLTRLAASAAHERG
jgi:hypothetical protein